VKIFSHSVGYLLILVIGKKGMVDEENGEGGKES
jgi:hypothetical protein